MMKKSGIIALSALLFATASTGAFADGPQPGQGNTQQSPLKRPPQGEQNGNARQQGGGEHNAQAQHGGQAQQNSQPGRGDRAQQNSQPGRGGQSQHSQPQGGERQQPQHMAQADRAPGQRHHQQPRHAQPDFRQGRPLPEKYRGEGYQVNDWHQRGLKAPPAGHRWQNIDGNYVLIAVATGVITSVITHH
ncbi:RcnB family protein [Erwinia sp. HDF1-3R]|uniref:RcnB family protein n=1 Tax=Erwinia sp. HDF1-3R TaxID=3141543 RepID=UPI0031F5BC63